MSLKLAAAIVLMLALNLAGAFLIKTMSGLGSENLSWVVLLGLGVVVVSAARVGTWLALGKRFQLSFIHPFLSLNYVLAVFLGMAAFDEPFRAGRLVGGVIIAASVVLLSRSSHARDQDAGGMP